MIANGGIAGLVGDHRAVGLRGVLGGADHRPRRRHRSSSTAFCSIDKYIDDPIGATSAHGLAGIWGTLACGIFASPRLAESAGGSAARASSTAASFFQLGVAGRWRSR